MRSRGSWIFETKPEANETIVPGTRVRQSGFQGRDTTTNKRELGVRGWRRRGGGRGGKESRARAGVTIIRCKQQDTRGRGGVIRFKLFGLSSALQLIVRGFKSPEYYYFPTFLAAYSPHSPPLPLPPPLPTLLYVAHFLSLSSRTLRLLSPSRVSALSRSEARARARGCTRFGPAIIPELRFPACRALVIMRGEPCISHRCIIRECFSRSFHSFLPPPLPLSLSLPRVFPFFFAVFLFFFFCFRFLLFLPSLRLLSSLLFIRSPTVPRTRVHAAKQEYNEFFGEGVGKCSRAAIKFDARLNAVIRSVIGITRLSKLTRVDFHSKRPRRAVNQPLSIRTTTKAPALRNSPLPFSSLFLSFGQKLFRQRYYRSLPIGKTSSSKFPWLLRSNGNPRSWCTTNS